MSVRKQTNADSKGVYKVSVYREFIRWSALPTMERMQMGVVDQAGFAKHYGVNKDTLTRWKQKPGFAEEVNKLRMSWGRDKTPTVINAIYRSAIQGNATSQKLWLEYFHTFPKEQEQATNGQKVILHHNDLRALLDAFPPDLALKFYGYLKEIVVTGAELRDKGILVDGPVPEADYSKSPIDEDEVQSIIDREVAVAKELERFNNLSLEERSMADIIRRGI